jgi:50S ribosomal subunit-associated GTPase HflX
MDLLKKPRIVVFNKIDLLKNIPEYDLSEKILYISALTGQGVETLIELISNEDKI